MRQSLCIFTLIVVLAFLALGCAGGGTSPASPSLDNVNSGAGVIPQTPVDQGTSPTDDSGGSRQTLELTDTNPFQGRPIQGSHQLWALWQFMLDPEKGTLEMVPLRVSSAHLNALLFLEPNGKYGMVQLAGPIVISPDKAQLDVDVRLVHPFPGALQFSGFDVKGILIADGTKAGFSNPDFKIAANDQTRLLNADGYTRWWNPTEFSTGNGVFSYRDGALGTKDSVANFQATLNGFKTFADTLEATTPVENMDPADRGVFRAGASNIRHYTIALTGKLVFNYAIDASWVPPTTKPPVVPGDFPPEANQPEPYRVIATEKLNSLYFESASKQGGKLVLDILVYDWQGGAPPPQGTVKRVVVEWPGLFAPTEATWVEDAGNWDVWSVTALPVAGAFTSTSDADYIIWAESTDGAGYGGILNSTEPLVAVNKFTAKVSDHEINVPPEITDGVTGNASPTLTTETYSVTAIDENGDPLVYGWSVEPQGNPFNFNDPGNGDGTININWATLGIGAYTVQAEVSDGVNPAVQASALDVMVGNTPPTLGDIQGLVDVTAVDKSVQYTVTANDPDPGQTLVYTWSFVPDGSPEDFNIPGDPGDGSMTIDYSGIVPGSYDINVQVTDGYTPVSGTPILVDHHNTLPTVGQVAGKTPVTTLDTAAHYSAPWSDPDTTQTLMFRWSLVTAGNPESFVLVGNPDGSIDVDWSTHPVGSYDLNLRANDGIGATAGTKLTVVKNNTPPSVGAVEGPENVSSDDTGAHYTSAISDIDTDQVLTVMWSVVLSGNIPSFVIPSNPDKSVDIDWSDYADGTYDVNVRVGDGFAQVEGSLLIVEKLDNQPPEVDDVIGPETVYHSSTASQYSAVMSDPDGDPLTVLWSVVAHGNAPNFVIPGAQGVPVTINWAAYPTLGDYDVNVQADDGINPPVQGGLLVVTLENSAPVVGTVAGKSPVDAHDTAANYAATYSDVDTLQTLTVMWSVVPHGEDPSYTIPSKPNGSVDINWSGYSLDQYDVNLSVSDGLVAVEGTLLVVDRINTAPTVGTVAGPASVYCTDTASIYQAPYTELDPGQTLTITWSLVPHGFAPVYNIPSNPDGSLTHDWSATPLGQYDVNVQVDDGFVQVTGTLLVVTKNNTPPTGGAVSGPAVATTDDVFDYSIVPPVTDCDSFQTIEYWYSVQPQGNPANYNISSPTGVLSVNWNAYGVGVYTVGARIYDGVSATIATPMDVTVTLPICVGSAHSFAGTINVSPYSVMAMSVVPRKDISFMEGGVSGIAGLGVVQIGPSTLGIFDADFTGSSSVLFQYFLGKKDSAMSIDTDPIDGRILTVTFNDSTNIKIIDSAIIAGSAIIGTIPTANASTTWVAVDVESNGDFWAVVRDASIGVVYRLVHYTYLADSPYYQIDSGATTDINTQVGTNTDIFDIAINDSANYLYLLEAGGGAGSRGKLHSYNLAPGWAQYKSTLNNVFSQVLNYENGGATGFAGYGDIDIDHIDASYERCRILAYGRLADDTSELVRIDGAFNLLDTQAASAAWPAFAINPEVSATDRNLIMPDTGVVEYWSAAVDW